MVVCRVENVTYLYNQELICLGLDLKSLIIFTGLAFYIEGADHQSHYMSRHLLATPDMFLVLRHFLGRLKSLKRHRSLQPRVNMPRLVSKVSDDLQWVGVLHWGSGPSKSLYVSSSSRNTWRAR